MSIFIDVYSAKNESGITLKNGNITHWKYSDIVDMYSFLNFIQITIFWCIKSP